MANLSLVVTAVFTGIAQGLQPLVSRSYGIGEKEDIRRLLNYAAAFVFLLSGFLYLLFFCAVEPIASVFNSEGNEKLQIIAVTGMKLYFTSIPFTGLNIILSAFFTSTEKALPAQGISLSRGLFLILPAAFLLAQLWGMTGIWLSCPATELIVSFVGILVLSKKTFSS